MTDKDELRDFIYLDSERVRSLTAQLLRGVPDQSTEESHHELGAKGSVEAGLWGIVKAGGGGDYRYFSGSNETRSFHHYAYSLFEAKLIEERLVTNVDSSFDFDAWDPDLFSDGQIVRIRGLIGLTDFAWLATMMESLPAIMKYAATASELGWQQQVANGQMSAEEFKRKKADNRAQETQLKSFRLGDLKSVMESLYGEGIRIKILPSRQHVDKLFVGSAQIEFFSDTAASMAQKYGNRVDAEWIMLGQINRSGSPDDATPLNTGNQVADSLEQVAFGLNQLLQFAAAVRFPAFSVTPLSLYRTIQPKS